MSTPTQRPTPITDKMEALLARATNVKRYYAALAQMRLMEVERDEAREQLEAMREAIKEAYEALDNCIEFINDAQIIEAQWHWEPVKQSKAALAKLQPFIKP